MSKSIAIALILVFIAAFPVHAQRGKPLTTFAGQSPDQMIAEFMELHEIPGMTLSIVQAPYIPRVVGYGVADKEQKLLASPNTLWPIGEMTQAYTAVAVMQLVEAGKLSIDSTLGEKLPSAPAKWRAITLRQLLGHTSGLPDYTTQPGFDASRDYTAEQILSSIEKVTVDFAPGTKVARSATNFYLLGLVIEKASGMNYEAFVTKGQIERLGLKYTYFPSQLAQVKSENVKLSGGKHALFLKERVFIDPTEVAVGYDAKGGLVREGRKTSGALSANAGLFASAADISIWDVGLAGEILVKKSENRAFLYKGFKLDDSTPCPANCGWRFPAFSGFMDITGNAHGCSVYLSRFTAKSDLVCVTLCCNKGGLDLTELARRVAGCFDARLGPPVDPDVMTCLESCYPVGTTMDRLEATLKSRGVPLVQRINHAAAAKKVGMDMRPTEVIIFGDPKVGTHLMLARQEAALDLPLRVTAWQDEKGSVWVGWRDPSRIAKKYGIAGQDHVLKTMRQGISESVAHATSPY
jgi:CubicO group peptidase (beta-lactamase class C family)/uncharacterized protein (DUF302 family)